MSSVEPAVDRRESALQTVNRTPVAAEGEWCAWDDIAVTYLCCGAIHATPSKPIDPMRARSTESIRHGRPPPRSVHAPRSSETGQMAQREAEAACHQRSRTRAPRTPATRPLLQRHQPSTTPQQYLARTPASQPATSTASTPLTSGCCTDRVNPPVNSSAIRRISDFRA